MELEVDNQGAVEAANSCSVGRQTCYMDVRQCFLCELKEEGTLVVKWIAGSENNSDMFTKNLDGPLFENFASVYVGKDKYSSSTE